MKEKTPFNKKDKISRNELNKKYARPMKRNFKMFLWDIKKSPD